MFEGVERQFEIIFCILGIEKKQLLRRPLRDVLGKRTVLRNNNVPSRRFKKRLWRSR
jgi:hypothetical protein